MFDGWEPVKKTPIILIRCLHFLMWKNILRFSLVVIVGFEKVFVPRKETVDKFILRVYQWKEFRMLTKLCKVFRVFRTSWFCNKEIFFQLTSKNRFDFLLFIFSDDSALLYQITFVTGIYPFQRGNSPRYKARKFASRYWWYDRF